MRPLIAGIVALIALGVRGEDPPQVQKAQETITVTARRVETRLSDTPASVVVLPAAAIATTAAATNDGVLRQVPGFTLFRRSGSEVANPTSQGVSLRGIGASGASRALVLDDGIPINDPFGGWVYWGRVPRASIARAEILRGGASDLYGSAAMSGVVQFVRRTPPGPSVIVESSGGSMRTATTSLFASAGEGSWRGSVAGDLYTTGGYVVVEPADRGAVDRKANSRHAAVDATVEHSGEGSRRVFLRLSHFDEDRDNGTALQANDTRIRQAAAGLDSGAAGGSLMLRAFAGDQRYAQTFSAIATDRATERLTVDQRVPSHNGGVTIQWSRAIAGRHALVTGVEGRDVRGETDEVQFSIRGSAGVRAGGHQRTVSAFVEDVLALTPRLSFTAGLRYDGWRNFGAFRDDAPLRDRSDSSWSPRLSALFQARPGLAFTASAYRAFRAPTLNELYRGFRVGNAVTLANEALGPETLSAFELGARAGEVRATLFDMRVDDTIANVTLSTTPSLVTRQRRNLGSTRTRGMEVEGEHAFGNRWRGSAGFLYTDGVVRSGELAGRRLPQVPRGQATAQILYSAARATFAVQSRWSAAQFEDDRNQLSLRSFFAADLFASAAVTASTAVTLAVENALDRRIETGLTPAVTLAPPRSIRVGVRYTR